LKSLQRRRRLRFEAARCSAAAKARDSQETAKQMFADWVVNRTEFDYPRRASKNANVGPDGKREYCFFKCQMGCGEELRIVKDSLAVTKCSAIKDHLAICPNVPDEQRVAKRARGLKIKELSNEKSATYKEIHSKCKEKHDALREENRVLKERCAFMEEVVRGLIPEGSFPAPGDTFREDLQTMVNISNERSRKIEHIVKSIHELRTTEMGARGLKNEVSFVATRVGEIGKEVGEIKQIVKDLKRNRKEGPLEDMRVHTQEQAIEEPNKRSKGNHTTKKTWTEKLACSDPSDSD
jgi:hypothetical protein